MGIALALPILRAFDLLTPGDLPPKLCARVLAEAQRVGSGEHSDTGGELRSNGHIRRTGLAQIRNVSRQDAKVLQGAIETGGARGVMVVTAGLRSSWRAWRLGVRYVLSRLHGRESSPPVSVLEPHHPNWWRIPWPAHATGSPHPVALVTRAIPAGPRCCYNARRSAARSSTPSPVIAAMAASLRSVP